LRRSCDRKKKSSRKKKKEIRKNNKIEKTTSKKFYFRISQVTPQKDVKNSKMQQQQRLSVEFVVGEPTYTPVYATSATPPPVPQTIPQAITAFALHNPHAAPLQAIIDALPQAESSRPPHMSKHDLKMFRTYLGEEMSELLELDLYKEIAREADNWPPFKEYLHYIARRIDFEEKRKENEDERVDRIADEAKKQLEHLLTGGDDTSGSTDASSNDGASQSFSSASSSNSSTSTSSTSSTSYSSSSSEDDDSPAIHKKKRARH